MYALSLGVSSMSETLPRPVYALLCGLNSATVGIIALAAVQLGQRAITDKVSRVLVFLGATAGMLYNALWYFPVLMVVAGFTTTAWDLKWGPKVLRSVEKFAKRVVNRPSVENVNGTAVEEGIGDAVWASSVGAISEPSATFRRVTAARSVDEIHRQSLDIQSASLLPDQHDEDETGQESSLSGPNRMNVFSLSAALVIVIGFFLSFVVILVLRALLENRPIGLSLFANLYLAGTVS